MAPLIGVIPELALPLSPTLTPPPVPSPNVDPDPSGGAIVLAPVPFAVLVLPAGGIGVEADADANVFLTLESNDGRIPCSGSSSSSSCGNVVKVTVGLTFELAMDVLRGVGPCP